MASLSSEGQRDDAEGGDPTRYIREMDDLIKFVEANSHDYQEVKRRVDEFYDKNIFEVLRNHQRQFMFELITAKTYSVHQAAARGLIAPENLRAELESASRPLQSRGSAQRQRMLLMMYLWLMLTLW